MSAASPDRNGHCFTCKNSTKQLFICIQCDDFAFCNDCWSQWPLHVAGAIGWDGWSHEKSNPQVVQTLREILEPTRTSSKHDSEFRTDHDTTWFSVGRDNANQLVPQDHGRFATLVGKGPTYELSSRYPQLVTFIGETGEAYLYPPAQNS